MPKAPAGKRTTGADGLTTVRGKRSNGTGSVYFDRTNQCWFATYRPDGEHRERKVRAKTQRDAETKRDAAIATALRTGTPNGFTSRTTMYELSSRWLANVAIDRVRASSHGAPSGRLTRARLGNLADLPVRRVTSEQVQEWQTSLLHGKRPLSPSTVSDTRTTLRQVLDCAIDHGLVATNPVPKVKGPKSEKRPGRHLSPDEAKQLVSACAGARYGVVVALLFAQGWRISEALGLAWQDVDLDAGTVVVRRAVVQAKGVGRTLGPPKTAGATGVHLLTPGVVARLRAHRVVQVAERRDAVDPSGFAHTYEGEKLDLIFMSEDGGLVARQAVDKLMRSKADELGIDSTRLGTHVGRRTVVTALYTSGETLEDIARHVGHSSPTTTAGYVAALGNRPKSTAARAAALLDVPVAKDA